MLGRRLRSRERLLETSERLLLHLETSLRYTAAPPVDLIDEACKMSGFAQLPFLCNWFSCKGVDFNTRWRDGLAQAVAKGEMEREDADVLLAFGEGCGCSDVQGQISHIRLFADRLHTRWEAVRKTASSRARLYLTLGLLGGGALALLCV